MMLSIPGKAKLNAKMLNTMLNCVTWTN